MDEQDDAQQRQTQTPLLHEELAVSNDKPVEDKRKSILLNICSFILLTEFCERLSYYGLAGSLVLLLQSKLNFTNADADNQYAIWSGVCYCTPLLGGYLADSYLGRFRCIALFSIIYLLGLIVLIFGVVPSKTEDNPSTAHALIFTAIYIIALGDGGIKPNVCTLGADQFDPRKPDEEKELESFFNWFYWSINVGALISFTLVASIAQFGISWLGGVAYRFTVGFSIPMIATTLAVIIFVVGSPKYKKRPPKGSILATSLKVVFEAAMHRNRPLPPSAATAVEGDASSSSSSSSLPPSWLDRAKAQNGGSFSAGDVEGVKYVLRLLPFLFFLVPYWSVYTQMSTSYQNQGCQMDLTLGSRKIAVSTLNLFDTLAIILLVPVFDGVVYPFFKRKGMPLTQLRRFGAGFVFAILAMIAAAFVEMYRKSQAPQEMPYPIDASDTSTIAYLQEHISACRNMDDFNPLKYKAWYDGGGALSPSRAAAAPAGCRQVGPALSDGSLPLSAIECDNVPLIAPVSVFWQIPQFLLIGISEILTSVTSYEFFYSQSPGHMRSFTQSLNLFTTALGAWVCIPIVYLGNANPEHQMVPSNLNEGYLASFFFLLAGILALDAIGFAYVAKGYVYQVIHEEEGGEEGEEPEVALMEDLEGHVFHDAIT